jgi:glycosyltransferase involved in cell wall biosynthesis
MVEELLYLAPTSGAGGYEVHSRGVLRELYRSGILIQHVCLPFDGRPVKKTAEMTKILEETQKNKVSPFAPALWLTLPSNVKYIPGRSMINFAAWEADRICPEWVMAGRASDLTIVPTKFLKQVWIDSGVPEDKVEAVPEGTDLSIFNSAIEPLPLRYRDKPLIDTFQYRFLSVLQLSNRKNVRNLIVSFIKAFENRKDVCLILKVSYMDREKDLDYYIGDLDLSKHNIFVCDQMLPENMMGALLANATHYYTLSCGEGWDLSCVDAGAMGKVIVAPFHTAYTEYLNDDRAYLIKDNKRAEAVQNNVLDTLFKGSFWFVPNGEEAVEVLRESVKDESKYRQKAKNFSSYIKENLTWEKSGEKLMEVLHGRF